MLLTDSDIISSADFSSVDSEILNVAATTKPPITIDGAGSICEVAWGECKGFILRAMQSYTSFPVAGGGTAAHQAAVNNVGTPARTQPRVLPNQIVTSDTGYSASNSDLKMWMLYHALGNFYRDAAARMDKDRYDKKYTRYRQAAESKWCGLRATGLPMVCSPLECPGAKHAFNAGTWNQFNVTGAGTGAGAAQPAFVAVTWYDASLYVNQANKGNAESGPSQSISFTIPPDTLLSVSIASLNPPNGQPPAVGLALGTWQPLNATHWNLYVGDCATALYLQQESIPVATNTFTLAAAPVLSGSLLMPGQAADVNLVFQNVVPRG